MVSEETIRDFEAPERADQERHHIEERREVHIAQLSDVIYADLFDGQRGGVVTQPIDRLVSDIVDAVLENWVDIRLVEHEPKVALAIRNGIPESVPDAVLTHGLTEIGNQVRFVHHESGTAHYRSERRTVYAVDGPLSACSWSCCSGEPS